MNKFDKSRWNQEIREKNWKSGNTRFIIGKYKIFLIQRTSLTDKIIKKMVSININNETNNLRKNILNKKIINKYILLTKNNINYIYI